METEEAAGPVVEDREGIRLLLVHSCFGSKVNQTIAKVIAAIVSSRIGTSVAVRTDPYRIIFKVPTFTRKDIILEEFY